MKIVVTIVGKDSVGIIAAVSTLLAENDVNILSINQNIMDGFFNMVMIADMAGSKIELAAVRRAKRSASRSRRSMRIFSMRCTRFEEAAASTSCRRSFCDYY